MVHMTFLTRSELAEFVLRHREGMMGVSDRYELSLNNNSFDITITTQTKDFELPLQPEEKWTFFDHADNIIIAFDKGNRQSFTDVKKYFQICREYKSEDSLIIIVGFITDHEEVTATEGEKLAQELSCDYFETNSIDKEQIHNIYQFIASKHLEKKGKEN